MEKRLGGQARHGNTSHCRRASHFGRAGPAGRLALLVDDHVHHAAAENWFASLRDNFATCPNTQGSLMRLLIREGQSAATAREILSLTAASPRHEFWPDDVSYTDVPVAGMVGHRQVTDAYLAQLARVHGVRLATFDQGMAKLHGDVTALVPAA